MCTKDMRDHVSDPLETMSGTKVNMLENSRKSPARKEQARKLELGCAESVRLSMYPSGVLFGSCAEMWMSIKEPTYNTCRGKQASETQILDTLYLLTSTKTT